MDNANLLIALAKYKYLKDLSGYSESYKEKLTNALEVVMDSVTSDLIELEIDTIGKGE